MNKRPSYRTLATITAATFLPLGLLAAALVEAYMKKTNPDNRDVTQALAYFGPSIVAGIGVMVLLVVLTVMLIVLMYKHDRNFAQAKLPLILLVTNGVLILALALTNNYTNAVQDQYLIDHGRPTLDQYFDQLEMQKQHTN